MKKRRKQEVEFQKFVEDVRCVLKEIYYEKSDARLSVTDLYQHINKKGLFASYGIRIGEENNLTTFVINLFLRYRLIICRSKDGDSNVFVHFCRLEGGGPGFCFIKGICDQVTEFQKFKGK